MTSRNVAELELLPGFEFCLERVCSVVRADVEKNAREGNLYIYVKPGCKGPTCGSHGSRSLS